MSGSLFCTLHSAWGTSQSLTSPALQRPSHTTHPLGHMTYLLSHMMTYCLGRMTHPLSQMTHPLGHIIWMTSLSGVYSHQQCRCYLLTHTFLIIMECVAIVIICPPSPLLRLSQSGMGGASMISSAHTVQLQESLREARKGLERSQDAQVASERSRRQLKAQLEELQKKYDDIYSAKLKLESAKLDMELQVRVRIDTLQSLVNMVTPLPPSRCESCATSWSRSGRVTMAVTWWGPS